MFFFEAAMVGKIYETMSRNQAKLDMVRKFRYLILRNFLPLGQKKVVLFPQIDRAKIFSSLTRPHSWMYVRIYIFCFKQKNVHRNNKQKKLNKIEKQKKPTKTGRKKILLSLTIFVNNKSNGIRWNRLTICSAYF